MSFFNSYTTEPVTGEFEMGGFELFPKDTQLLAAPDEVKLDQHGDNPEAISIRWTVIQPIEFANRKVFQKIKINDPDENKKGRAMRMLLAIDANAGGQILKANRYPDEQLLSVALMNKPQLIKLDVWEKDGKKTNWVKSVAPYKKGQAQAAPKPQPAPAVDDFTDDIPF